jgi:hypothetical protein
MKSLFLALVLIATGSVAQAASTYTGSNVCCKGTENKFSVGPQAFTEFSQKECVSKNYVFYANQKNCPICCNSDHKIVTISDWQHITTACARPNSISWTGSCNSASPTPTMHPTDPLPPVGKDGKCCVRTNPRSPFDCQVRETPTWQAINTGMPLADALKMTCQLQYTANDNYCKWDTSKPECMPKDPCAERGMFSVKGDKLNVAEGEGQLCCTSKHPKEELLAGKKVCCEVIRKRK